MTTTKYSQKTQNAINKYGIDKCREAFKENKRGNGASTISYEVGFPNTRAADAAINAGREIAAREALAGKGYTQEQADTIIEWNIGLVCTPACDVLQWAEYNRSDAMMIDR